MTEYIYRYFIFVEWGKLIPANAQANAWDPDEGGEFTFGDLRLSANGQEPPTHSGCNTPATEAMKTGIFNAFSHVPFYKLYSIDDGWTWETALADAGLEIIEVSE